MFWPPLALWAGIPGPQGAGWEAGVNPEPEGEGPDRQQLRPPLRGRAVGQPVGGGRGSVVAPAPHHARGMGPSPQGGKASPSRGGERRRVGTGALVS